MTPHKKAKTNEVKLTRFIIAVGVLSIGVASGVVLQKYGVGNILKIVGMNYRAVSAPETIQVSESSVPEEFQGRLRLFILAGQSNMSGRGDVPQSAQSRENKNLRIYAFGNDYQWKLATEPIDDPRGQVDKVSEDSGAGFSPALSFATALLKRYPDIVIGLIPCAKGSTSIHQWRRSLSDNTLYGACLKRVRVASVMGNVAGILFFQGESDAMDPKQYPELGLMPNQWASEFTAFVGNWRSDLGLPGLPVVFAQLGTNATPDDFINWAIVKEQQRTVELPFCAMITTDDLALKDTVHFTTESYQTIGKRFAEAYVNLLQGYQK
jgi:hypothetical protein